jgi:hypothetical protein
MKNANKILFFFFITACFSAYGQSASDKLKDEQARLEKKIAAQKLYYLNQKTIRHNPLLNYNLSIIKSYIVRNWY